MKRTVLPPDFLAAITAEVLMGARPALAPRGSRPNSLARGLWRSLYSRLKGDSGRLQGR